MTILTNPQQAKCTISNLISVYDTCFISGVSTKYSLPQRNGHFLEASAQSPVTILFFLFLILLSNSPFSKSTFYLFSCALSSPSIFLFSPPLSSPLPSSPLHSSPPLSSPFAFFSSPLCPHHHLSSSPLSTSPTLLGKDANSMSLIFPRKEN